MVPEHTTTTLSSMSICAFFGYGSFLDSKVGENEGHTLKQRGKETEREKWRKARGWGEACYGVPDPTAGILHKSYVIFTLYLFHERAIVILILQVTELRPRVVLWPAEDHTAD